MVAIVNKKILGYLQIIGGIAVILAEVIGIFQSSYDINAVGEGLVYTFIGLLFIIMGADNIQQ